MTPQEFQNYKESKLGRLGIYIIAMIAVSIFVEKWSGYLAFTFILLLSYYNDYKCESQWIKDGSVRIEDLKN
jgi:uncharacterized membrane protein